MSQIIPMPSSCSGDCPDAGTSGIPGPTGATGAAGSNAAPGISAFTYVADHSPAAQPEMPAELGFVDVDTTGSTAAFQVNQLVVVGFWGTMKIAAVLTDQRLTLQNLEDTANGQYPGNAPPGTPVPAFTKITPTGAQGAAGANPADALLSGNNLGDVADAPTSRNNLGLGTVAVLDEGMADANIPQIADAAGLVNGEIIVANSTGLESRSASDVRIILALGTMATQFAASVNITGGVLNGTLGATTPADASVTTFNASGAAVITGDLTASAKIFTPPSAIQSLLAATAINPNAAVIKVVGNGGAVSLTALPTITTPAADGQRLLIIGTDNTNTVTLQDESNLAGTKLRLAGGNDVVLGIYDTLELVWDATLGFWIQVSTSNN